MLKELFESSFYQTFPSKSHRPINLIEQTCSGRFSLLDSKACNDCRFVCNLDVVRREQLKISSAQEVNIISIDQVMSYVNEDVGETCDYMLETDMSVTLIEMTCSTTDYVVDKRPKARRQLRNTLEMLFTCPVMQMHIEKKGTKYAVFSWRETFDSSMKSDDVEGMMRGMFAMADEIYSPDNELNFDFDFKLKEIRYPHVLSL